MKVKAAKYWNGKALDFRCPGCGDTHLVTIKQSDNPEHRHPVWGWNGSYDAPTFSPSLLVRTGHFVSGEPVSTCWNCQNPEHDHAHKCYVCHSFVNDGRIQFLGDCTHPLAGQTVEIPELEGEPA